MIGLEWTKQLPTPRSPLGHELQRRLLMEHDFQLVWDGSLAVRQLVTGVTEANSDREAANSVVNNVLKLVVDRDRAFDELRKAREEAEQLRNDNEMLYRRLGGAYGGSGPLPMEPNRALTVRVDNHKVALDDHERRISQLEQDIVLLNKVVAM